MLLHDPTLVSKQRQVREEPVPVLMDRLAYSDVALK
jgi:hypothetical protein